MTWQKHEPKIVPIKESELWKRFQEAKALLKRAARVIDKPHWKGGETDDDVSNAINAFLSYEDLEDEIFECDPIPLVPRSTGRAVPDLTKREHICEFQRAISST